MEVEEIISYEGMARFCMRGFSTANGAKVRVRWFPVVSMLSGRKVEGNIVPQGSCSGYRTDRVRIAAVVIRDNFIFV